MKITRDREKRTLTLDQTRYAEKVAKRFGLENTKPVTVPLPTGYNPHPNPHAQSNPTLRSKYQSVIGSLLYIMLGTRPDLAFSVIKMSQFSANPTEEHLQKALYIATKTVLLPTLIQIGLETSRHLDPLLVMPCS